jgi:DNA-binding CsgD family transcriptional regulator
MKNEMLTICGKVLMDMTLDGTKPDGWKFVDAKRGTLWFGLGTDDGCSWVDQTKAIHFVGRRLVVHDGENQLRLGPFKGQGWLGRMSDAAKYFALKISQKTRKPIPRADLDQLATWGASVNALARVFGIEGRTQKAYKRGADRKRKNLPEPELRKLIKDGRTIRELSTHFNVTEPTVRARIIEYGLSLPRRKQVPKGPARKGRKEVPKDELAKLVSSGFTRQDLAEHFGVSRPTIGNRLKEYGLSI